MRANSRGDEHRTKPQPPTRHSPVRPVAKEVILEEQVVHDGGSGLIIQIEKRRDGRSVLHISGGPLEGTRIFTFSENGLFESSESKSSMTPPSWNREVC